MCSTMLENTMKSNGMNQCGADATRREGLDNLSSVLGGWLKRNRSVQAEGTLWIMNMTGIKGASFAENRIPSS